MDRGPELNLGAIALLTGEVMQKHLQARKKRTLLNKTPSRHL